jgi:hypothetical protein
LYNLVLVPFAAAAENHGIVLELRNIQFQR